MNFINFTKQKNQSQKKEKNKDLFFGKKSIKTLPDNFFEKILDAEMKLKTGFSNEVLQELINYYTIAIEYYESINDQRYLRFSQSLNLLLSQPEVLKHISMQTKSGKIKVMKEERKKIVLNEIEKVDKKIVNKEVENIIKSQNEIKLKEDEANKLIENDLNIQSENFKKRLEEKKKKIKLNKSDIEKINLNDNKNSPNKEKEKKEEKKKKKLNKIDIEKIDFNDNKNSPIKEKEKKEEKKKKTYNKFEVIDKYDNIFGNEIDIEPIKNTNNNLNNINLTELINSNLEFFFSEFDSLFSEQITQKFISEVAKIENEKHNELIQISEKYASLIKENECKLTLPENESMEEKEKIGNIIYQLGIEENDKKNEAEKKYKDKLNKLKQNMKEKGINSYDWIKKIKEKYVNDIEKTIYEYYQN